MGGLIVNQNEVHVWVLRLTDNVAEPEEYYDSLLTQDEIDRADKLRFKEHQLKFKTARGNLRLLLSKYLNKKPRQLWIRYGKYGKPYLSKESNKSKISFNLSHSQDTVLYAFTKEREVGIDVEHVRAVAKADKIIERFFSDEEKAFYKSQDSESKSEKFFKLWCAREAYSKAIGSGLNLPKDKIDISFATGEPINTGNKSPGISIHELPRNQGYRSYLAVTGEKPKIILRDIQNSF